MDEPQFFPEEFKAKIRFAFEKARSDRDRYFNWLKDEINIAIELINKHDKIYILGGLGIRLLQASPNLDNQLSLLHPELGDDEPEDKQIKDDEIEVLLEYAISLASASSNNNKDILPTQQDIDDVRNQLSKIKHNLSFYEMSAEAPANDTDYTHWLKTRVMEDTLHVRGAGYQSHVEEIYKETFAPHDGFLLQYYGFTSTDLLRTIKRLDLLIGSKLANIFGSTLSHKRFVEWSEEKGMEAVFEEMNKTGKHFIRLFTEDNMDLFDERNPDNITTVQVDEFYCFSTSLSFRNIFNITANLLQSADTIYYEQKFKGNTSPNYRDNYIETKVKKLFEKLLPTVRFYHSLDYEIVENGINKKPELDILGVGNNTLYIIEVKAGELNKIHRRGAILGLKDRIKETIGEGSYQCYRAEKFIQETSNPEFSYVENNKREILKIDKKKLPEILKISVTYEHFSTVAVNLKYLIETGILSSDYKWTWIVSLFDLMIFADLIETENDFKDYLSNRFTLYERNDVTFSDEIDILGFFLENKFPLRPENTINRILMVQYKDNIDTYYNQKDLGMSEVTKPKRKT